MSFVSFAIAIDCGFIVDSDESEKIHRTPTLEMFQRGHLEKMISATWDNHGCCDVETTHEKYSFLPF